jgi:hypothetical protein
LHDTGIEEGLAESGLPAELGFGRRLEIRTNGGRGGSGGGVVAGIGGAERIE